jgi:Na+/citrate or Na+/malate symporter
MAVAAFVGAFTAFLVFTEIAAADKPLIPNKTIRYFAIFLVGIVVAILLAMLVGWVAGLFGRVG